ncbi:hypothetical protein L3067_19860 [Xanthomonas sp. PPL568]|uniref:DUF7946 domain-containing protein n=1 Tax=Xanthomonas indica TaxID=2912242 RepID=UPI001F572AC4|nr:hypothetical protein [Xanthomonas indica]MCI2246870.1 hypothetical protein [Xanthomonas indica]
MKLVFVVKYDKEESWQFDGVDAYWGTRSLAAIVQIFLLVIHASVNEEIVVQAPSAKGFRVVLGKSRDGSWEQLIHLAVTDPAVLNLLSDLGKDALYDILKWAMLSGVGVPFVIKNRRAKKRIRQLEMDVEDLQERLGQSIKEAHLPVKNQGLKISVMGGRTILAEFDRTTLEYLETEILEDEQEVIYVGVSRFNARTGWGRCIEGMDAVSVPFSPSAPLSKAQKGRLAENLRSIARGDFRVLPLIVSRVVAANGALKRYRLHGLPAVD